MVGSSVFATGIMGDDDVMIHSTGVHASSEEEPSQNIPVTCFGRASLTTEELPAQQHEFRDMFLGMRQIIPEIGPRNGIYGHYVPWADSFELAVKGLMLHEKKLLDDYRGGRDGSMNQWIAAANQPDAFVVHMQLGHNVITELFAEDKIARDRQRERWRIYVSINLSEVRHVVRGVTLLPNLDVPWPHLLPSSTDIAQQTVESADGGIDDLRELNRSPETHVWYELEFPAESAEHGGA